MIKYRLLTAAILIPIVLLILFYAPFYVFVAANAAAILAAGWEWTSLAKIKSVQGQLGFMLLLTASLVASFWIPHIILWIAGAWWLFATYLVLTFSQAEPLATNTSSRPTEPGSRSFVISLDPRIRKDDGKNIFAIIGLLLLTPTFTALNLLQEQSPELVFWLFLLIWGADSFAYFTGRLWGKHKLIPKVSPGKTWEGYIAALLTSMAIGVLVSFRDFGGNILYWVIFAVVIGNASVLGDLFESLIKRTQHVKDSGSILPGHGGLLDRIDSLTAAAPIFAIIYFYCFI